MKERGILFSAPMVRALLNGTKTQTRRIAKLPARPPHAPERDTFGWCHWVGRWQWQEEDGACGCTKDKQHSMLAPFWRGQTLWVRETWKPTGLLAFNKTMETRACSYFAYRADEAQRERDKLIPWRPSIFMPRWASRITLEITDVRVERLQSISPFDACAEGVGFKKPLDPVSEYADLWNDINGAGSWDLNPFVWALTFTRIEGGGQ